MDSILNTIKKLLGYEPDYDVYDTDLVIHINSCFMELNQLGVGPEECFMIEDDGEEWDEFLDGDTNFEAVKTYIYLKCKLVFDPPATSFGVDAINKQLERLEWRLNWQAETKEDAANPLAAPVLESKLYDFAD